MLHNFMNILVQKPREGKNTHTHTHMCTYTEEEKDHILMIFFFRFAVFNSFLGYKI